MNMDGNEFCRHPDSYHLFNGIGSPDENERNHVFKVINQSIDAWYLGFGSPICEMLENSVDSTNSANTTNDSSLHFLIDQLVPDLIRLAMTAPYEDVREQCKNILISLYRKSFIIPKPKYYGISKFIPNSEFEHIWKDSIQSDENNQLKSLLYEYFEDWGRIENYVVVMGLHPNYLEQYIKMYNHLFRRDGSLPYKERFYLAIMAAAQIHSPELINRFITEFLAVNGDREWLNGLNKAPPRLKAIGILGQYLVHQPWQIEPKNIKHLIHGPNNSFHISMSQLMQAVVIISHVSSLACFLFGTGVCNELDHSKEFVTTTTTNDIQSHDLLIPTSSSIHRKHHHHHRSSNSFNNDDDDDGVLNDSSNHHFSNSVPPIRNHRLTDNVTSNNHHNHQNDDHFFITSISPGSISDDDKAMENNKDCPIEVLMERMREALNDENDGINVIDVEKMFADVERENETIVQNPNHPSLIDPLSQRFLYSKNFGYSNFNSSQCAVLRNQDYSWIDEASSLADRYYPEVGGALEEKFKCSFELTYNTMGDMKNIDTSLFRLSVWNYVHSLYGIRHDDFNYAQIESMLTKPLKLYIKKMATRPCTITKKDFRRFFPQFKFSEKVHIALMVADARQQACLLHTLNAMKSVNK